MGRRRLHRNNNSSNTANRNNNSNNNRNKSLSSSLTNIPVPFPHDGPVYYYYNNYCIDNNITSTYLQQDKYDIHRNANNNNNEANNHEVLSQLSSSSSVLFATQLLVQQQQQKPTEGNIEASSSSSPPSPPPSSSTPTIKVFNALRDATTTKEQLQVLQAYRSTLLRYYKNNLTEQEKEKDKEQNRLIGLYRLLLEWSLSIETPMPLRRAIQSSLKTLEDHPLLQAIEEENTAYQTNKNGKAKTNIHDDKAEKVNHINIFNLIQQEVLESLWSWESVTKTTTTITENPQPAKETADKVGQSSSPSSSVDQKERYEHCLSSPWWSNYLHSLDVAINCSPLALKMRTMYVSTICSFLVRNKVEFFLSNDNNMTPSFVQDGLVIAEMLKVLLLPATASSSPTKTATASSTTSIPLEPSSLSPSQQAQEQQQQQQGNVEIPSILKQFLLELLGCSIMPTEGYNALGIAYGRLLFILSSSSTKIRDNTCPSRASYVAIQAIRELDYHYKENDSKHGNGTEEDDSNSRNMEGDIYRRIYLPPLARLTIVQGIAATLEFQELIREETVPIVLAASGTSNNNSHNNDGSRSSSSIKNKNMLPVDPGNDTNEMNDTITTSQTSDDASSILLSPLSVCWRYFLRISQTASDPLARLSAIKGLTTLAHRCIQKPTKKGKEKSKVVKADTTTNEDRGKESNAVSSKSDEENTVTLAAGVNIDNDMIQETLQMVLQAWENPPLRKVGTAIPDLFQSLVVGWLSSSSKQLKDLNECIWNQPVHRKGRYLALDILLSPKLLQKSSNQSISSSSSSARWIRAADSLLEGMGDRGPNTGVIADLWIKILGYFWDNEVNTPASSTKNCQEGATTVVASSNSQLVEIWMNKWVPSLVKAMLSPGPISRRKQVAVFSLPRIVSLMKGSKILRPRTSDAMAKILLEIEKQCLDDIESRAGSDTKVEISEALPDYALWAKLEVARQAAFHKLLTPELKQTIASCIPLTTIRIALTHSMTAIRLLAFQSLDAVVTSYSQKTDDDKVKMWKYAFPYAIKAEESKDYISSLLQCLAAFLDRLSIAKVAEMSSKGAEKSLSEPIKDGTIVNDVYSFIVDFLINDVVLRKGAYPGTVADKEGFILAMLECILVFVMQDQSYSSDNCVAKNGVIFKRRRHQIEVNTMSEILKVLLSCEVMSVLFALLHSMWDKTRGVSFRYLSKVIVAGQTQNVSLPIKYVSDRNRIATQARGIFLASSPRQREADTGARLLAFQYISLAVGEQQVDYLTELVEILENRLMSMKDILGIVSSRTSSNEALPDGKHQDGRDLPLAHGIIHGIRLAVEHNATLRRHGIDTSENVSDALYQKMIKIFCNALRVSLTVVADVRNGELIEGMDGEIAMGSNESSVSTPLNVNTGAIGANGTFASVDAKDKEELERRFAIQRVVVGSWLLTKETCAAVAETITAEGFRAPYSLVEEVGMLLISTLTSLKHAGAAFAAHNSLQTIATACLRDKAEPGVSKLPMIWASRLLEEISVRDKVRDSTLRRSTGYALGFLAIMRSETATRCGPSSLCPLILAEILKLSLPSELQVNQALQKLGLGEGPIFAYHSSLKTANKTYVSEEAYQARSRVHALNILRLIILDAPLANEVGPIIGDSIISAILGYNDPSWAVRNSATMVFSATMLRAIDADKNASNTDRTSSNAITISELFRRYSPLSSFLQSVLKDSIDVQTEKQTGIQVESESFPTLLLLSRVQPIVESGATAAELTSSFVPMAIKCLRNPHHSIRSAAARALTNLCSGDQLITSSASTLLEQYKKIIVDSSGVKNGGTDFNAVHGALLAIDSLTRSSTIARQTLKEMEVDKVLFSVMIWTEHLPEFPPCCIATAVETIVYLSLKTPNYDESFRASAEFACKEIVTRLGDSPMMIGAAKLCATVASGLCRLVLKDVWHSNTNNIRFKSCLDELSLLFQCDLIDIRLASVKSFKKSIYKNIDNHILETSNDDNLQARKGVLVTIGRMLLEALHTELLRDASPSEIVGTHPPTVRRLSRCFLECSDAYKKILTISNKRVDFSDFLYPNQGKTLWDISLLMTRRCHGLGETVSSYCSNGETPLAANAVELMSIEIATTLQQNDDDGIHNDFVNRLQYFTRLVTQLNDPESSWRSRYSAAIAIETSQILKQGIKSEPQDNNVNLSRKILLFEILRMLQDSDNDVRYVAGRVAREFSSCVTNSNSSSQFQSSVAIISQLLLEDMYGTTENIFVSSTSQDDQNDITEKLLRTILTNCDGLSDTLILLEDEMQHSHGAGKSLSNLINDATNRKIFEDEDLNPLEERLLANQLATRMMFQMMIKNKNGNFHERKDKDPVPILQRELLECCQSCLEIILRFKKQTNNDEIIHEMTRYPTVFPSLHSVIVASVVIMFQFHCCYPGIEKLLSNKDNDIIVNLYEMANSILKMESSSSTPSYSNNLQQQQPKQQQVHPEIMKALHVLLQVTKRSDSEDNVHLEVDKCFFLLRRGEK